MARSEWWKEARCLGEDTEVFFLTSKRAVQFVRRMCAQCPVMSECLDDATDPSITGPLHGMRAGRTVEQQQARRTHRQRARRQDARSR